VLDVYFVLRLRYDSSWLIAAAPALARFCLWCQFI